MKTLALVACLAVCCVVASLLPSAALAAASQQPAPKAAPPQTQGSAGELPDRVTALERENLVLREDLGKARLDAVTGLQEAAKEQAEANSRLQLQIGELSSQLQRRIDDLNAQLRRRTDELSAQFQRRVDELNAQLAAERDREARRSKHLWLAVGILALGIIATD